MSGKETLKIIDRFVLKHKLGQGTFSKWVLILTRLGYIYEAYDKHLQKDVALKVEKKDKNKTILLFEYNVLLNLKGKSAPSNLFFRSQARGGCLRLRAELWI